MAWKGKSATLYYRVDGGAVQSLTPAANDGAASNPPYNSLVFADTDHYSVKLTGLTATSTIEFSTDESFTAVSNETSGRAIVCGVKLTDEAINPEEGGNENPTPEPEGTVTIAEAIAAADGAAIVIENATVVGVYARGVLIEDATGKLLVYAGSAVSANVGDVVKVEGSMATYAGLRQVATPTVTVTGSTSYSYPTATVMDGAAMDAYLSNPVIKYVEYTGTLSISGYYYNVTVDGASTAQHTEYFSAIANFDYRIHPQWNVYVKGAYETASIYKANGVFEKGLYRTTWNTQACIEFFPKRNSELKIFGHLLYKGHQLTDRAKALGAVSPHVQRVSLGFVYTLPVF